MAKSVNSIRASVWASASSRGPDLPKLDEDIETEVAIIGGGFTGLATARHLGKLGIGSVVLEANHVGWGASGRNAGMAVPRFKKGFATLAGKLGAQTAVRLHAMALEAMDTLEEAVREHPIDCGFTHCGHITAAHTGKAMAALENDAEWLSRHAGDNVPRILDSAGAQSEIGSAAYAGGYLDPRGAGIDPLAFVRGLARALNGSGTRIYVRTRAESLDVDRSSVVVRAAGRRVRARSVVFATNAYSSDAPEFAGLSRRVVPVATSIVATEPLPADLAGEVMPARRLVSDTKHLMNYFRLLPGNRLIFGGRGAIVRTESNAIFTGLEEALVRTFPVLDGQAIAHRWSGHIAMTRDSFPHLGRLSDNVWFSLGYNGRGVALSSLLGKYLARLIAGDTLDAGPLHDDRFDPIPLHGLRLPVMQLVAMTYKLRDRIGL